MKNNYWRWKRHCRKQRREAGQMNAKSPPLIRRIPSVVLWWLNHLWLNKPHPGGDRPSVHRYLGKTPLRRSHRTALSSHTVRWKMQGSPRPGRLAHRQGSRLLTSSSMRLLLIHSVTHPFSHSDTHSFTHLQPTPPTPPPPKPPRSQTQKELHMAYLSMITGSDGVSFLFPQLFLSQHRLQGHKTVHFRTSNTFAE